jgi:lipopolysaccharide transport system permease protein
VRPESVPSALGSGSPPGEAAWLGPQRAPSVIREVIAYRTLIKNLVFKELKLKYRGSILGVMWSLLNPLLILAVYTFAFKLVMRVQMDHYAYFLLVGLLPWTFFAGSARAATGAIVGNANLIKKVYFVREALPIATVLFEFAQLLLALAVFLPALMLISGVGLYSTTLLVFPVLLLHLLFTTGLAFALSALTTSFRDLVHLTEVALVLLFWVTPIVYSAADAPAIVQPLFPLSPLAAFAVAYQDVLFWGRLPAFPVTLSVIGWTAASLLMGHAIFRWFDPSFAEDI